MKDTSPDEVNKRAQEQKEEHANDIHSLVTIGVTIGEEMMHQDAYEQQAQQVSIVKCY